MVKTEEFLSKTAKASSRVILLFAQNGEYPSFVVQSSHL
jgi:hypothetical protein